MKGFDLLINAWANIKEELNIIGSGKELLPLQELIEKLGLSDRIKILTDHSYKSIEEIYKYASGLIVSSLREGGPRTVLEAINHNIPVLGTNVGIMPQIIPRGSIGRGWRSGQFDSSNGRNDSIAASIRCECNQNSHA